MCAGDPANWRETAEGFAKIAAVAGTINTILLVNTPVAPGALARTAITMTEGKSAALQRLAVPSCYSADLATGTGTDQFCVAAPRPGRRGAPTAPLTSASPHMKFGEITGPRGAGSDDGGAALAERAGGEPHARHVSRARAVWRARSDDLRRPDVAKTSADARAILELLRKNSKSAFYEPLVGASAHALATVLDRVRHGTIPAVDGARRRRAAGCRARGQSRGPAAAVGGVPSPPAHARHERPEAPGARGAGARMGAKWKS